MWRLWQRILALAFLPVGFAGQAFAQPPSSASLATVEFYLVGGQLAPQPGYQAVPKSLTTQVDVPFVLPDRVMSAGITFGELQPLLPKDLLVKAELRGPAFASPLQLSALPNHPLELPTLPVVGIYTVENIRMESGGQVVAASPNVVQVESFEKALVTQVTTRQLTAQEIADRGIAINASNFNVINFTAALSFQSRPVQLQIPIAVPVLGRTQVDDAPPSANLGDLSAIVQTGPQGQPIPVLNKDEVIPNLQIQTFTLDSIAGSVDKDPSFPPISGIVVIPGSIGYLHQFFEATLLVTNGAPAASALSIRDIRAAIVLPAGLDRITGTDAAPGDDPLRAVGTTTTGGVPLRALPVKAPGPDGQFGTPDDVETFAAQQTGQAAFTLEGLKEGTHSIEFAITATLEGLPRGPVQISGKATGAVLVRNPNFAITLSHPSTVRAGVEYTLAATVSNTSDVAANLVQVTLDPHAVSGATLLSSSTVQIRTLAPHTAGTVSFRLRSQITGKVTATVFPTDDQVQGAFVLRAGVGANAIPLSPDTLVLSSFAEYLPDSVRESAVGFLGEAYSVSTAPAGALPTGIARITRKTVQTGAANVGEGGLRIFLGEPLEQSLHTLLLDLLGSDTPDPALDGLRRLSPLAGEFAAAVGAEWAPALSAQGALGLQRALATGASDRGPYLSIMTAGIGGPAAAVQVRDGFGRVLGGETSESSSRNIPHADLFPIGPADAPDALLAVHSAPLGGSYAIDWRPTAAGQLDLGVVLPGASGLEQVTFAGVAVAATDRLTLVVDVPAGGVWAGHVQPLLGIDRDGDGAADATVAPATITTVPDPGPMLEGAVQLFDFDDAKLDPYGRLVAVLMSKRRVSAQAQTSALYTVEENVALTALLQPSGRVVFVGLRDPIGPYIDRRLTVTGLTDRKGVAMQPAAQSVVIRSTATEPGAVVQGRVLTADGRPVTTARISLVYAADTGNLFGDVANYRIGTKPVDAEGGYHYDYASSRFSHESAGFLLRAEDAATGRFVELATQERFAGQRMTLDLIFPGQGTVTGVVRDDRGQALGGAAVTIRSEVSGIGAQALADPSGRYTFADMPVGNVLAAATAAGGYYGAANGTLAGDGATAVLDLVLFPPLARPEGRVIGTVYADDGATSLGNIPVVLSAGNGTHQNYVRTAVDGSFAFERVPTGGLSAEAIDPGTGNRARASSTLAAGETANLTVIFNALGSISGTVYTQFGLPAAGALVVANGKSFAFTAADGTYTMAGIPLGGVSVRAQDTQGRSGSASTSLSFPGQAATAIIYLTGGLRASIVGAVYERDGVTPVPNVSVRVIVDIDFDCLGSAACPPVYKVLQATTDAQGGYRIDGIPIPPKYPAAIAVRGNNVEVGNAPFRLVSEGQAVKTDVVLNAPGTVTGTVRDQGSGNQPTGANVIVRGIKPNEAGLFESRLIGTTQADPQTGRFAVGGAWPGGFSAEASNTFRPNPARASGAIRFAGDVQDVTLTLIPPVGPGSISGVVNRPNSAPVGEGVQVTVTLAGQPVTVTTAADGRFRFAPILPAGGYSLTAEDPITGLKATGYAVVQGGQDTPVTLRLLGLGMVEVLVKNAEGAAAPSATVTLARTSFPYDKASGAIRAGDGGRIVFTNITEGDFSVDALDADGLGGRVSGRLPGESQTATVTLQLAPSGVVTGRFLAADGRTPIGNGQIQLTRYGRAIGFLTSSTDPATAGGYRFEHVPLGPIAVDGFDPVSQRRGRGFGQLASSTQTLVVDVIQTARGTVTGRALSADGTRPVEGGKITLSVSGLFPESFQALTAPDGSFAFPGVPAGDFRVAVTDPLTGLQGAATGRVAREGETVSTEVRLQPTGTVSATVVRFDGVTPVAGATVRLVGPQTVTLQSDPNGRISRALLPLGHYTLTATAPNGLDGGTATADLAAQGDVADVLVRLNGVGSVTGAVFESDGSTPALGALVTLSVRGVVSSSFSFQTGADGRYRFAGVPAGALSLSVRSPDGRLGGSASGTLARDGETVTIDLSYQASGTVTGQIIAPDGVTPSSGAILTLRVGNVTLTITADNEGQFTVESIPLSTVSLEAIEAFGRGVAYRTQPLAMNGQVIDFGSIVLDNAPIRIVDVQPVDGAVNVNVGAPLSVTFDEPADPQTINSTTVRLFEGNTALGLARTLSTDGKGLTIAPAQVLKGSTRYTLLITTGVQDLARHPLPAEVRTTFVTLDNVPPTVSSISPADTSIQIDPSAAVRVTFSEPVDPGSVSLILTRSGLAVAGRVDVVQNGTVAIFTPTEPLATNATYTASVSDVKDLAGNAMTASVTSRFDTLDMVPPTVTGLSLPAGVSLIRGRTVTATATVADADVASVEFTVDDRLAATDTTAPFAAAVTLTPASGDTLGLKAIAVDRVGNRSPPAFLSITVEADQAPTIAINAPSAAEVGTTITVGATGQDDVGITAIRLAASGALTSTQTRTFAAQTPASASFSLAVPASAAPGATIALVVTATDSGGATTDASATVSVVDTKAPTVAITGPAGSRIVTGSTVTVTVSAADTVGVSRIDLTASAGTVASPDSVSIAPAATAASASFTFTADAAIPAGQIITLTAKAEDASGNRSAGATTSLTVVPVPPTLSAIDAVAASGSAASAGPSANLGQTLTVVGADLRSDVRVRFTTRNDAGVAGTVDLPLVSGSVSADQTRARVVVSEGSAVITGPAALYDPVSTSVSASVTLQIVPVLDPPTATGFGTARPLTLTGSGFVEDGLTLRFPTLDGGVIDVADTGANIEVTNRNRTLNLLAPSGVGPGLLTVTTAGGTSAPVTIGGASTGAAVLAIVPNPVSVAPGQTAAVTVGVPTADPFDRTVALATADPAIATVPAGVVLPGGAVHATVTVAGVAQGSTTVTARLTNPDGSVVTAGAPVYVPPPFAGSALAYTAVGVDIPVRSPSGDGKVAAPHVGVDFPESGTTQQGSGGALSPPVGLSVAETVTGLSHPILAQGETAAFRVRGTDLGRVTSIAFDPATGISAANPPVIDADGRGLSLTVSVSSTAAEGVRNVRALTASGQILPAVPEAATVTITKPVPEITTVSPGTVTAGSGVTLTITGRRLTGAATVSITPATGFVVQNPPAVSQDGTQATVMVTVDPTVTTGVYRVSITTPAGTSASTLTEANGLTVTAP